MTRLNLPAMGSLPEEKFPVAVTVRVSPLPLELPAFSSGLQQLPLILPHTGTPDARQILSALDLLGKYFAMNPLVRQCAENILGNSQQDNDLAGAVKKFLSFVKQNLRYMPDPAGMELVTLPDVLLSRWISGQPVIGDCDDHVLLFNSLCLSVDIRARPVGIRLPGAGWYNHVISQVNTGSGWTDLDPCAKDIPQPDYLNRMELAA